MDDISDNISAFFEDNNLSDNEGDDSPIEDTEEIKERKKRSLWWEHYTEIVYENGDKWAKCSRCEGGKYKITEKSNGSTGNMKKHVLRNHPDIVLNVDLANAPFVFSQEKFREALVKWIAVCDQPFCEVDQPSFIALIKTLNPEAELVTDKTIRSDLMATYQKMLQEMKVVLSEVPGKISLTVDGWTSSNSLPFASIRGHWMDTDFQYRSTLLDFPHIVGDHSGLSIKNLLAKCFERLGIPFTKIMGITLDNALNNDTLFFWLEEHGLSSVLNHVRCLDHIMNLAVQDILTDLRVPNADNNSDSAYAPDELEDEVLEDIDMDQEVEETHSSGDNKREREKESINCVTDHRR